MTVNDTNAESTATALEKLTKNATSFTADDTLFAATTFVKLVTVNVTTDKVNGRAMMYRVCSLEIEVHYLDITALLSCFLLCLIEMKFK